MVGGLEATAWSISSIVLVMEAAVGVGPAQPFVKEEEQESNLHAFCREAVLDPSRSNANFTIEWNGHYRIEGDAFIYVDSKTGGTRAILGYPTQKLEHGAHDARGN
jgi:hypothetical protein